MRDGGAWAYQSSCSTLRTDLLALKAAYNAIRPSPVPGHLARVMAMQWISRFEKNWRYISYYSLLNARIPFLIQRRYRKLFWTHSKHNDLSRSYKGLHDTLCRRKYGQNSPSNTLIQNFFFSSLHALYSLKRRSRSPIHSTNNSSGILYSITCKIRRKVGHILWKPRYHVSFGRSKIGSEHPE